LVIFSLIFLRKIAFSVGYKLQPTHFLPSLACFSHPNQPSLFYFKTLFAGQVQRTGNVCRKINQKLKGKVQRTAIKTYFGALHLFTAPAANSYKHFAALPLYPAKRSASWRTALIIVEFVILHNT